MIWDGETVYTTWGYRPLTQWAVAFHKGADGYHTARDRGAAQDIYAASIAFHGPLDELQALEAVLDSNRQAFSITCGIGEEVFGPELDYSSPLSVTVEQHGEIERVSFAQYAMPLRLRHLAPAFKATTPSLSALRLSNWRYGASSSFDIKKQFSYSGAASYLDHGTDVGVFTGEFTQTGTEMEAIRRALLSTVRGNAIPFPDLAGITRPFGQRKQPTPFQKCHIIEWEDLGRENFTDWRLRITFAQANPYFTAGDSTEEVDRGAFFMTPSDTPDYFMTPGA